MRCLKVRRSISPYLDGLCSDEERLSVKEHLDRCGACRAVFEEISEGKDLAGSVEEVEPPADMWLEVREKIVKAKGLKGAAKFPQAWAPRPVPLRSASIVLAVILMALALLLLTRFYPAGPSLVPVDVYASLFIEAKASADSRLANQVKKHPLVTGIRDVSLAEAQGEAEFTVTAPDELAGNYKLERIRQIRLGRRLLFQAIYSNGSNVICLFEQSSEHPIDFGDLEVRQELVGEQICRKCSQRSFNLFSWKQGSANLTLIADAGVDLEPIVHDLSRGIR